jgi:hypothetical protein
MAYESPLRLETWLFQRISTSAAGTPVYKRLKYNFVRYDGNPERVIEPVNQDAFVNLVGITGTPFVPRNDFGQVEGFEFFDGRPFEVFAIDDFDAATVGLQAL